MKQVMQLNPTPARMIMKILMKMKETKMKETKRKMMKMKKKLMMMIILKL